jgi:hypothetical protein
VGSRQRERSAQAGQTSRAATGHDSSVDTRANEPQSVSSQAPSTSVGGRCTSTACHSAAVGPCARLRAAMKRVVCTIMRGTSAPDGEKATGPAGSLPPKGETTAASGLTDAGAGCRSWS